MKPSSDSGAALLTTLLIVAALSAIAVATLDDMRRSQRLGANASSVAQAQWYAIGADSFARTMALDLLSRDGGRTILASEQRLTFPLDHGLMGITVRDASTCININGVAVGAGDIYQRDDAGARQLEAMMVAADIPVAQAADLVNAVVAWIDTDGRGPGPDDEPYLRQTPTYMTGGEPLAEISELRAIRGFTPEIVARLRPWLCALPVGGPSPVNVNALRPAQALVLVGLTDGSLSERQAAEIISARPVAGWSSLGEFWGQPLLAGIGIPVEIMEAASLETRFLDLEVEINHLDAEATMSELLVRRGDGFVTAARRWTDAP